MPMSSVPDSDNTDSFSGNRSILPQVVLWGKGKVQA